MEDAMITTIVEALPLLVAAAILGVTDPRRFRLRWLLIALVLHVVHEAALTRFWWQFSTAFDGQWNWSGKLLALALSLAIAALPAFGLRRSGFTFRQACGSWPAWVVALALCITWLAVAIFADDGSDAESAAFMWTMPGLEEEAFFRGILLLALNEAYIGRRRVLGASLGWGALLTAILFGSVHGLGYDAGTVTFDAGYFASTFVSGLVLVWLRERTGSLLAPIICHSVRDGVFRSF
jgi:membrane protease YdiL (CAAX protease family)